MSGEALRPERSLLAQVLLQSEKAAETEAAADNVVSLPLPAQEPAGSPQHSRHWLSAIDLVHEAREAIRFGEERTVQLEADVKRIAAEAGEEIGKLKSELQRTSRELEETKLGLMRAEKRAADAEARAAEAEAWLLRLHKSVVDAFGPLGENQKAAGGRR
jgi:hypothetical protein